MDNTTTVFFGNKEALIGTPSVTNSNTQVLTAITSSNVSDAALLMQELDILRNRVGNLETVLSAILPDFCKSTASEWIVKKENEFIDKLKTYVHATVDPNHPSSVSPTNLSLSGTVTQLTAHMEGQTVPLYALQLTLTVGGQTTNCTVKLPAQIIKSQIMY